MAHSTSRSGARRPVDGGFSEYQPVDQRPSPDSTEVLIWYSPTALYVGIRAFQPAGSVRATLADRDRISADDNVELHLDTFRERRRAFVFIVNPLGVQADGTRSEGGGFIPGSNVASGQDDLSADFIWQSKGRLTADGYEVEIRIPFSSLRYPIGGTQRWGLQVDRHVQYSGYEETWTPVLHGAASFIAQSGELEGLAGLEHGHALLLNPEFTNTVTGAPAGTGWGYGSSPQLGGNIRWGIGSNFVLNGTVKPDFSQVEADATQIAADERFALFYPELRPFFVEGSDQFNVPNTMVYTRRIVHPDAAVKFTGKLDRTDVAVLSALDDGSTTATGEHPLVDVVRLQQSFGAQSTAGMLYTDRVGGGRENRVAGADTHIVFGKLYFAQFQGEMSATRDTGVAATGPMWDAELDRTGRQFGFHYALMGVHPNFQDDNGFVSRTGIVQPSISNRYTWLGKPGAWLERYQVFGSVGGVWRYDDFFAGRSMLEQTGSLSNSFTFRGGWTVSITPSGARYAFDSAAYASVRAADANGLPVAFVPLAKLSTSLIAVSIATPQFHTFAASVGGKIGNDVDFGEASSVRRRDFNASLDLRPDDRLRVSATYLSSEFFRRSDGVRTQVMQIPRLRVEYQLSRSVLVRIVAQYTASLRRPLLDPLTGVPLFTADSTGAFEPSVEDDLNTLRVDALFSYRPAPGTVFFAGYGNGMTEVNPLAFTRLRRTTDGFFVKLSYVFRIEKK